MNYPRYPEYKPSGVEWLGELPGHWEVKRLKYCATCNDDVLPESTPLDYRIRYVDISSVSLEQGIEKVEEYDFDDAPSRARRRVRDGDTILSTVRTYLKAVARIETPDETLIVSTGFAVIRPGKALDSGFLSYLLRSDGFVGEVVANSVGVSYPAINASQVMGFVSLIPPIEEQRAIADFLDRETVRIDALIGKKQQFIELLQEKRAALISRAVTRGLDPNVPFKDSGIEWLGQIPAHWQVKSIKRTCLVKRGASPRPIDDPIYFDDNGEYSWVRISDVTSSDRYLEKTEQRLSKLGESLSVRLEPGELFLSIAGSVGKPIITKIKCCIHDGFVYFWRYRNDPEFLYYVFVSGRPYQGLGKLGTQLNLNTDTVGDIKVGWPPVNEQRAVAAFLHNETNKLDALGTKVESAIDKLKEYRAALIAAAVTGKIDVRET